jgi:hypothetical protein
MSRLRRERKIVPKLRCRYKSRKEMNMDIEKALNRYMQALGVILIVAGSSTIVVLMLLLLAHLLKKAFSAI